jgi:hypothetical protein
MKTPNRVSLIFIKKSLNILWSKVYRPKDNYPDSYLWDELMRICMEAYCNDLYPQIKSEILAVAKEIGQR